MSLGDLLVKNAGKHCGREAIKGQGAVRDSGRLQARRPYHEVQTRDGGEGRLQLSRAGDLEKSSLPAGVARAENGI